MINNATLPFFLPSPHKDLRTAPEASLIARWGAFSSIFGITMLGFLATAVLVLKFYHRVNRVETLYGAPLTHHAKVYKEALTLNVFILVALQVCLLYNLRQISPKNKENKNPRPAFFMHILLLLTMIFQAWNSWALAKRFEPERVAADIELNNMDPEDDAPVCEDGHEYNPAPPYIPDRVHVNNHL